MSKATEWISKTETAERAFSDWRQHAYADRPVFRYETRDYTINAYPERAMNGHPMRMGLQVYGAAQGLEPAEAIKFARWILDTFEDT